MKRTIMSAGRKAECKFEKTKPYLYLEKNEGRYDKRATDDAAFLFRVLITIIPAKTFEILRAMLEAYEDMELEIDRENARGNWKNSAEDVVETVLKPYAS